MNDEKYDYREAVKEDVRNWLRQNPERIKENLDCCCELDMDKLKERMQDSLWVDDNVTGNASGSYTFHTWTAECYLCHNMDLLAEALEEYGVTDYRKYLESAETADVTIRCYLLPMVIEEVVESIEINVVHKEDETEEVTWKFDDSEEIESTWIF